MSAVIDFRRPAELVARVPPEARGLARDEVTLLVTEGGEHRVTCFSQIAEHLRPGDLVVVNTSATIPASLPARGPDGEFRLNLSTDYGRGLWLAEPRWSHSRPGPLPLATRSRITLGPPGSDAVEARVLDPYPGLERLRFVRFDDARTPPSLMSRLGTPIRYGYTDRDWPLSDYQTIFASVPGSAEMPSAARPFTTGTVRSLENSGLSIAQILLHTGVSSLDLTDVAIEGGAGPDLLLTPEPFFVPKATADAVNRTRHDGGRVVAVGTTVARALESAWTTHGLTAEAGFTRHVISPESGVRAFDALLTGLHDPVTSHLALLEGLSGREAVTDAYAAAIEHRLLWHEWGDVHLILP